MDSLKIFRSIMMFTIVLLMIIVLFLPAFAQKTTIEYAVWGQPYEVEMEQKYLDLFMKKNPDIQVNLTTAPFGPHHEKLLVRIAGGNAPDVFVLSELAVTQYIQRKLLANLDEYIKRDNIDLSQFYDACLAYVDSDGEPYAIGRRGGSIYGLPTWNSPCLISVNLDMMGEAGLTVNEDWDWDIFLDYCKKLTLDKNGDGKSDQFGTQNILAWQPAAWSFVASNGGKWFNDDETESTLTSPETMEAYKFLADMSLVHHVAPTNRERKGWALAEEFVGKNVASAWSHPWGLEAWSAADFEWTPVLPPMKNGNRALEFETCTIGMFSNTKHPEEAWELVKFLGTDPECLQIMLDYNVAPAIKSWADKVSDPKMKKFIESMAYGVAPQFIAQWPEVEEILNSELDLVSEELATVEEALEAAQSKINALLQE
ncbi:ABC transporter substrate-binding protein [Atribacter laminatus]|uniref:ABC transporter substrate-binding protein YesO n=1 Tax=Atribacter laminatus TaxID=2847778 RepID=A0A7T1F3N0_ATRLM|nr:sugar ABC transporter substrate-binding protein [Atribacter laminatus]QPM68575.1 Putative ABC transporter substrate-binding protein YesO [Atribacter laminatus]